MPLGNGTGPAGQGPGTGRGLGKGGGRGRQLGGFGLGPSGFCICPKCSKKVPHERGTPCYDYQCPDCGTRMTREK